MSLISRAGIAVVAVTAITAVAACGSGKTQSGPSASQPAGTPIKIMQMAPEQSNPATGNIGLEMNAAANAAVQSINEAGGIKDVAGGANHPLQLVTCNVELIDEGSEAAACARQATATNSQIVAFTGKYVGQGDPIDEILAANIPIVASFPISGTPDVTHSMSFPLSDYAQTEGAGAGLALQSAGANKIMLALADTPDARSLPPIVSKLLKNGAADEIGTVYYPLDPSADITSYAVQVADKKPDGVLVVHSVDGSIQMIKALRTAGYKGKIAISGFLVTKAALTTLGSAGDGVLAVSNFAAATDKVDPTIKKFNASMDKYAPKAERTELAVGAWVSVNVIAQALEVAKTQDSAGLAKALQGLTVADAAAPKFTLGTSGFPLLPDDKRVPRATVQVQVIKGGAITPMTDGEFLDLANPSKPVKVG